MTAVAIFVSLLHAFPRLWLVQAVEATSAVDYDSHNSALEHSV